MLAKTETRRDGVTQFQIKEYFADFQPGLYQHNAGSAVSVLEN